MIASTDSKNKTSKTKSKAINSPIGIGEAK